MQRIETAAAPKPEGHYAQAIVAGGQVYVSGQLPIRPDGTVLSGEPFADQARQTIANLLAVLAAAGSSAEHLVKVTAYVVGVDQWPVFNQVYAEMLGAARPARTVVPVGELRHGCLIEIDAIGLIAAA